MAKVMLVDDDKQILDFLTQHFENRGDEVIQAEDGKAAVSMAAGILAAAWSGDALRLPSYGAGLVPPIAPYRQRRNSGHNVLGNPMRSSIRPKTRGEEKGYNDLWRG